MATKSSATDPVSDADREAEEAIVGLLTGERPDDEVVGEEGASREGTSGRRWVIDPLDGTVNYLYGLSGWCVSIYVEDDEGPVHGLVHDPLGGETFRATRGGGAEVNGHQLSVREPPEIGRALVATGFSYEPDQRAQQARVVARILPRVRDIRRAGAAALDLSWVAAGRLDGYYERGLKPWDWGAGRLLVVEAGGAVQELAGDPGYLVASSPRLLPELVALLG